MLNSNYIWIIGMFLITLVIMLVIMPGLIDYLHKIKFGQTEREEGLASHKDYCLVPGDVFIETKKEFFGCSSRKLLALGYPRYDQMMKGLQQPHK